MRKIIDNFIESKIPRYVDKLGKYGYNRDRVVKYEYKERVADSMSGALFGVLFFFGSFYLLYFNEGRVNLSDVVSQAVKLNSSSVSNDPAIEGKLVSVSGKVESNSQIGDDLYLNPNKFIAVERLAEMYSWQENVQTSNRDIGNGAQEVITTHSYEKMWQEYPRSSASFKNPEGHENPQKIRDSLKKVVPEANIGAYKFNPQEAILPEHITLTLDQNIVTLPSDGSAILNGNYIYIKNSANGSNTAPDIGDVRISYGVLKSGFDGTVFGKIDNGQITRYNDSKGNDLFRLFFGSHEGAVEQLKNEDLLWLWGLRGLGFMMMFLGLSMVVSPINTILQYFPLLGRLSLALTSFFSFLIAIILSISTIIISKIFHNIYAVYGIGFVIFLMMVSYAKKFRNKAQSNVVSPLITATNPFLQQDDVPINPDVAPNKELLDYVKYAKSKGMTKSEIKEKLIEAGWDELDIKRAFSEVLPD